MKQWYFLWDFHFRQVSHTTNIQCPRWFPLHHGATGDSCRRSHGQSAKGRTSGAQICSSSSYCGTSSFEPLDQKGMGLWNVRKLGWWIFQRICFIVVNCIELYSYLIFDKYSCEHNSYRFIMLFTVYTWKWLNTKKTRRLWKDNNWCRMLLKWCALQSRMWLRR